MPLMTISATGFSFMGGKGAREKGRAATREWSGVRDLARAMAVYYWVSRLRRGVRGLSVTVLHL